jgi:hypothetical protein
MEQEPFLAFNSQKINISILKSLNVNNLFPFNNKQHGKDILRQQQLNNPQTSTQTQNTTQNLCTQNISTTTKKKWQENALIQIHLF